MNHDPATVPVRRAATVVVIRDAERPEVLMLKRNRRSVFVPDMWVFPGGAVDAEDHHDDLTDRLRGLEQVMHAVDMSASDAAAHWAAVLRETYEEAGLMLGHDADGRAWTDADLVRHTRWRDALNAGETDLASFVAAADLVLDAAAVRYIARFVTPLGRLEGTTPGSSWLPTHQTRRRRSTTTRPSATGGCRPPRRSSRPGRVTW